MKPNKLPARASDGDYSCLVAKGLAIAPTGRRSVTWTDNAQTAEFRSDRLPTTRLLTQIGKQNGVRELSAA